MVEVREDGKSKGADGSGEKQPKVGDLRDRPSSSTQPSSDPQLHDSGSSGAGKRAQPNSSAPQSLTSLGKRPICSEQNQENTEPGSQRAKVQKGGAGGPKTEAKGLIDEGERGQGGGSSSKGWRNGEGAGDSKPSSNRGGKGPSDGRGEGSSSGRPPKGQGASSIGGAMGLSDEDTRGSMVDGEAEGDWLAAVMEKEVLKQVGYDADTGSKCKRALERFQAARTLSTEGVDPTKHIAAAKKFQEAQMQRQRAGLETNIRKQGSPGLVAALVEAHEKALNYILDASIQELTVELLCKVHGTLTKGQEGMAEPGKLRSGYVKVAGSVCCAPELVAARLSRCLDVANQLIKTTDSMACIEVSATLIALRVLDLHPFRDGNGRMARIIMNWMLNRLGLPFVICLCPTQEQRKKYTESLDWMPHGRPWETLKVGNFGPLRGHLAKTIKLVQEQVQRAWEEFERLRARLASAESDSQLERALRRARERQREETCMICLEEHPNIATLCCGSAVHLNCMAKWLSEAAEPSCITCRRALPPPPPRPQPAPRVIYVPGLQYDPGHVGLSSEDDRVSRYGSETATNDSTSHHELESFETQNHKAKSRP